VIIIFGQGASFFGYIAPFIQAFSEARGAATPVYRLIDEVKI
jgi:hypothetical protein